MAPSSPTRTKWWTKVTRDIVLFASGLGLIWLTGLGVVPERPMLYPVYVGMIGLVPVWRYAEARQESEEREP